MKTPIRIVLSAIVAFWSLTQASSQTITVTTDPATPINDYVSISEFNTDGNIEGWGRNTGAIGALKTANGSLEVITTGGDPYFFRSVITNAPAAFTTVEVRVKLLAGSPASWEMFWGSTGAGLGGFSGGRRVGYNLEWEDGEYHILSFDMADVLGGNALRDFRIDPGQAAGNRLLVDYVRVGAVSPDTDGDGLPDAVETKTGIFVSSRDTGTDPTKADSDGDGYSDSAEVTAGTNPNDKTNFPIPAIDRYTLNSAVYVVSVAIGPNAPSVSNGKPTSFEIAPALPAGFSFNTSNGSINGTPASASAATDYVVTASFAGGVKATRTLNIEVRAPFINFPVAKYSLKVSQSFGPVKADIAGPIPTSYSVSPALPGGFTLDPGTGEISGTGTDYLPPTTYSVKAKYASFPEAVASITLSVLEAPGFTLDPPQKVLSYFSLGEFSDNTEVNGWFRNGIENPFAIVDGALVVKAIGGDPYFGKALAMPSDFRTFEIRFKLTEGTDTGFRTYWAENAVGRGYSESTAVSFPAEADGEYHTYQLDLSKALEGSLNSIRLDTGNGAGDVLHVDYWRIGSFSPSLSVLPQAGGKIRVIWQAAAAGFTLQSAVNITGPWSAEGANVTTAGAEKFIENAAGTQSKFYRLFKQ